MLNRICLPQEITPFEAAYLNRTNRGALIYLGLHIPILMMIAWANQTNPLLALELAGLTWIGPLLASRSLSNPRHVSMVFAIAAMLMGGLLVHFGRGIWTIEMHFYFFASLALMTVYANPLLIVVAAATVAVHHGLFWLIRPSSVFNYEAPLSSLLVHSAFLILEAVGACFVARSFFDNVIGLDKIVQERTREVESRNQDMRLVLDNVSQGLMTLDRDARIRGERSGVLTSWLGAPLCGQSFGEYLAAHDANFSALFEIGWQALLDDFMPMELILDQMPNFLEAGSRKLEVSYTPIWEAQEVWNKLLVVISDVTAERLSAEAEAEKKELLAIFEKVLQHRSAFSEFIAEAEELVAALTDAKESPLPLVKRQVHTLKGNCGIYGLATLSELCHEIENRMESENSGLSAVDKELLCKRWHALSLRIAKIVQPPSQRLIELEEVEVLEFHQRVLGGLADMAIADTLINWTREPIQVKFEHFAAHARELSLRLQKGELEVHIESNRLRLAPERWTAFWANFTHVIRNAVDHGLGTPENREQAAKPARARLTLRSYIRDNRFLLEVSDDGFGIDWQQVRSKAEKLGLSVETPEQLGQALFVDGLSTRTDVTEFSGRGVGLSALRAACEDLQGSIRVLSEQGVGTTFQFGFPVQAMGQELPNQETRESKAS